MHKARADAPHVALDINKCTSKREGEREREEEEEVEERLARIKGSSILSKTKIYFKTLIHKNTL